MSKFYAIYSSEVPGYLAHAGQPVWMESPTDGMQFASFIDAYRWVKDIRHVLGRVDDIEIVKVSSEMEYVSDPVYKFQQERA